jgi:hypothetical protein
LDAYCTDGHLCDDFVSLAYWQMECEPLAQNHRELKQIGFVEPLSLAFASCLTGRDPRSRSRFQWLSAIEAVLSAMPVSRRDHRNFPERVSQWRSYLSLGELVPLLEENRLLRALNPI